jgi:hypothetical protein
LSIIERFPLENFQNLGGFPSHFTGRIQEAFDKSGNGGGMGQIVERFDNSEPDVVLRFDAQTSGQ